MKRKREAEDSSPESNQQITMVDPCFEILCSYLEIYNEKVYDLLDSEVQRDQDLQIREDRSRNIIVQGLKSEPFTSFDEFNDIFLRACKNRKVASTRLNMSSSRSHACLILTVRRKQPDPPFNYLTGKLHLIDLAGSEDNRRTGNSGMRLVESSNINKSLFVLKKVVNDLNAGKTRIPYRDSRLTRLLQDSLGGRSQAIMIANIAPCASHFETTYSTLCFAMKSKAIVNKPTQHSAAFRNEEEKQRIERLMAYGGSAAHQSQNLDLETRMKLFQAQKSQGATNMHSGRSQSRTAMRISSENSGSSISQRSGSVPSSRRRNGLTRTNPHLSRRTPIPANVDWKSMLEQEISKHVQSMGSKLLSPLMKRARVLEEQLEKMGEHVKQEELQQMKDLLFSSEFEQRFPSHLEGRTTPTPDMTSVNSTKSAESTPMRITPLQRTPMAKDYQNRSKAISNDNDSPIDASIREQLSNGVGSIPVDIMSPGSKRKTARYCLKHGGQLLRQQDFTRGLYYLEQAQLLLPNNENLREKIVRLKKKVSKRTSGQLCDTPGSLQEQHQDQQRQEQSRELLQRNEQPKISIPQRTPLQEKKIQGQQEQQQHYITSKLSSDQTKGVNNPVTVDKKKSVLSVIKNMMMDSDEEQDEFDKENGPGQTLRLPAVKKTVLSKRSRSSISPSPKAHFRLINLDSDDDNDDDVFMLENQPASSIAVEQKLLRFINDANLKDLQLLATIGEKRAERILQSRPFASLPDLSRIGIAAKGVEQLVEKNLDSIDEVYRKHYLYRI